MDPATISAVIAGISALGQLVAKLITSRGQDAAQALSDMRAELGKLNDLLNPGGKLDQDIAAHDAKLDAEIAAAEAQAAKP